MKRKIKISKKEWDALKKSAQSPQVAPSPIKAPPVPERKTPTPSQPNKPPTRDPFKPRKPAFWPKPKAKQRKKFDEINEMDIAASTIKSFERIIRSAQNYLREAHPAVRNWWTNIPPEHIFSEHPFLRKHGPKLSEEGFEFSRSKLSEGNLPPTEVMKMVAEVQELIPKILAIEANHEEELIEMAKDITAEIWGIDKSKLIGDIEPNPGEMEMEPDIGAGGKLEEDEPPKLLEITPDLKEKINKRITSNVLIQGASIHAMASVHHLVAEKIRQISPELLSLYTRLSGLATHQFYALNIPAVLQQMANLSNAGIGWNKIVDEVPEKETPEEQEPEEEQVKQKSQQGEPAENAKILAKGICFPVLCQEMFKGVMSLITSDWLADLSPDELHTVCFYADRLEHEPWEITVGPAMWRKILSILPKDLPLSKFVQKLHDKTPEEVHDILNSIIEEPNRAKEIIEGFKEAEETEEKEQYISEEQRPAGELVVPEETFEGLEDIFEPSQPTKEPFNPPQLPKPKSPKTKKDKGAGDLIVPPETFEGLEDIFQKRKPKINKKT